MNFNHDPIDLPYEDLVADTTPNGRTYLTPQGNKLKSITTVLGAKKKEALLKEYIAGKQILRAEKFSVVQCLETLIRDELCPTPEMVAYDRVLNSEKFNFNAMKKDKDFFVKHMETVFDRYKERFLDWASAAAKAQAVTLWTLIAGDGMGTLIGLHRPAP